MSQATPANPYGLCNYDRPAACQDCPVNGRVFCQFERRHVLRFALLMLPVFLANGAGFVRHGAWKQLLLWIGTLFFFLQVPENLILCSHCPYYAQGGRRTLLCHVNAGLLKLWPFNPRPMTSTESAAFMGGLLAIFGYPIAANTLNREWLAAFGGLVGAVTWGLLMRRFVCSECPNFSCPLNTVPDAVQLAYLRRNPVYAAAWGIAPEAAPQTKHDTGR
jgi:hypothetical protein